MSDDPTAGLDPQQKRLYDIMQDNTRKYDIEELANELQMTPSEVRKAFETVQRLGAKGKLVEDRVRIPEAFQDDVTAHVPRTRTKKINIDGFSENEIVFGATSDTHLAAIYNLGHARTKTGPLWDFYRLCEGEGINTVFHGGNWIDGDKFFNRHEVRAIGVSKQLEILINEYPYVPGVKTVLVAGDDHEGWYWQNNGTDIVEYAALKAKEAGRDDLEFIGYIEADIALIPGEGFRYNAYGANADEQDKIRKLAPEDRPYPLGVKTDMELPTNGRYAIMRLMHGGGGTGYTKSQKPQKIMKALQSGEKPQVLLIGHYHKSSYDVIRNTHVFQLGTTEEPTSFMRKQSIPADVGSWIIRLNQDESGAINRVRHRWIPYMNRSYNFDPRRYTPHSV